MKQLLLILAIFSASMTMAMTRNRSSSEMSDETFYNNDSSQSGVVNYNDNNVPNYEKYTLSENFSVQAQSGRSNRSSSGDSYETFRKKHSCEINVTSQALNVGNDPRSEIRSTQRPQSDEKEFNKRDFYFFATGLATITVGVGAAIASTFFYNTKQN